MHRIFILSPANSGGERARLIFNPRAGFELAHRLQRGEKAPIGEIFSFLSGLYFRGKQTYARAFARPPGKIAGTYVITSNRGLIELDQSLSLDELRDFAAVPIDPEEERYARPLEAHARKMSKAIGNECEVILLGSISTNKYAEPLMAHFGERLLFPASFVGRGDMSRGGLLLRCVAEGRELEYVPVSGAIRRGKRPEKLKAR
ncbi:MAG: hypothetical protein ACXW3L_07235, partial [Limisphaerales bacterium]